MKKNVGTQSIGAQMITAADGTAFTGAVTLRRTIDNGTQALGDTASGVCAHEGNGYHSYVVASTDCNGDHIAFTFTGSGAIPATIQLYTMFPQTVDNDTKLTTIAADVVNVDGYNLATQIGTAGAGLTNVGTIATVTNLTNERGKYQNGAVWIGPSANTNTVSYVDGIITNPVSTVAAAKTIADALNIRRFHTIRTGATQIAAAMPGYGFDGTSWSCTTTGGSRDVGTSSFTNAKVIGGIYAGTTGRIWWNNCEFDTGITVGISHMQECVFSGTLTLSEAGDYDFIDCASIVAGTSAPVFAIPAGTVNVSFRRWSGGISITGITTATTISIDLVSGGTVTLAGADGNVQIRGMCSAVTDSRTGTPTLGTTAVVNQTTIATPTNITAGTITTVTNLTNLPAGVATSITNIEEDTATTIPGLVSTVNNTVDTIDTNVGDLQTTVGAAGVGLTSVALADATSDGVIADAIWNAATVTYGGVGSYGEHVESLTAGGDATEAKQDSIIAAVITNAAGVDIAADIIALKAETVLIVADTNELQADDYPTTIAALQTDLDTLTAGVTLTTASVDLIWDELLAGHVTADSAGLVLNEWQDGGRLDLILDSAGGAGDPWITALPGAYSTGTAGYIVGTNLDAKVSGTSANASNVSRNPGKTLNAFVGETTTFPEVPTYGTNGSVLDCTSIALTVTIETLDGTDVELILDAALTKSATGIIFTTAAATSNASTSQKIWSARRDDTGVSVNSGRYNVESIAKKIPAV